MELLLRPVRAGGGTDGRLYSPPMWVEIQVEMGTASYPYVGEISGTINDTILSRPPDEFVRLENVRWFDNKDQAIPPSVTRQEDLEEGYTPFAYFKRSHIVIVTPIRDDARVWAEPPPS
ncbi:MAG: hypothetical protein ACYTGX_14610 [Planctomycetota bacterium]